MTTQRELLALIERARKAGATIITTCADDGAIETLQCIGLKGCGEHRMPALAATERLREVLAYHDEQLDASLRNAARGLRHGIAGGNLKDHPACTCNQHGRHAPGDVYCRIDHGRIADNGDTIKARLARNPRFIEETLCDHMEDADWTAVQAAIAAGDGNALLAAFDAVMARGADSLADAAMRLIHPSQMSRDEALDSVLADYTRLCPAVASPKPSTPNAAGRFSQQVAA